MLMGVFEEQVFRLRTACGELIALRDAGQEDFAARAAALLVKLEAALPGVVGCDAWPWAVLSRHEFLSIFQALIAARDVDDPAFLRGLLAWWWIPENGDHLIGILDAMGMGPEPGGELLAHLVDARPGR